MMDVHALVTRKASTCSILPSPPNLNVFCHLDEIGRVSVGQWINADWAISSVELLRRIRGTGTVAAMPCPGETETYLLVRGPVRAPPDYVVGSCASP